MKSCEYRRIINLRCLPLNWQTTEHQMMQIHLVRFRVVHLSGKKTTKPRSFLKQFTKCFKWLKLVYTSIGFITVEDDIVIARTKAQWAGVSCAGNFSADTHLDLWYSFGFLFLSFFFFSFLRNICIITSFIIKQV